MPRDMGGGFPNRGQQALPPGPSEQSPHPAQWREALGAVEQRTQEWAAQGLSGLEQRNNERFAALERSLRDRDSRVEDLIRTASRGPLRGPGSGLGAIPQVLPDIAAAFASGCCVPDVLTIPLLAPRGQTGQIANGIVTDTTGPNLISEIAIFARISSNDERAADFAKALIQCPAPTSCPPSQNADCCSEQISFACPPPPAASTLLPIIDVRGASIPVGFREVRLLCCGTTECQASCRDPNTGDVTTYTAQVPIIVPDKPEALDAEVEYFTNNVAWQYSPIPADFFYRPYSITEAKPDCMGMCGFIACLQQLTAAFNILRAPRFDIEIIVGFAGFRIQSCGGLCGTIGA